MILCNALAQGMAYVTACDGGTWRIGECPNNADSWEITALASGVCECEDFGYGVRPCTGGANWGGVGTTSCSPPSQTMKVVCE